MRDWSEELRRHVDIVDTVLAIPDEKKPPTREEMEREMLRRNNDAMVAAAEERRNATEQATRRLRDKTADPRTVRVKIENEWDPNTPPEKVTVRIVDPEDKGGEQ
jgi:hypothetical protein